jgi:hypothetical protein
MYRCGSAARKLAGSPVLDGLRGLDKDDRRALRGMKEVTE